MIIKDLLKSLRRINRKHLFLTFSMSFGGLLTYAQQQVVSSYDFSQSLSTYSPITNGITIDSAHECSSSNRTLDTDGRWVMLPFTFNYNNNLVDSVFVNNDGAVVFGYNATGSSTFTSTNSNILGVLTPMNRDLWGVHVTQVSTTSGSNVLSNVNSFVGMEIGKCIYGSSTNIPYGTTITAIDQTNNTITTSANAGATNTSLQLRIANGKILSKVRLEDEHS